jgi:hypothetical protein
MRLADIMMYTSSVLTECFARSATALHAEGRDLSELWGNGNLSLAKYSFERVMSSVGSDNEKYAELRNNAQMWNEQLRGIGIDLTD